jgi:hypothetical protein
VTQHFQIVIPGGANNVRSSFLNTWTLGLEAGKRVLSDINVKLDELDLNVGLSCPPPQSNRLRRRTVSPATSARYAPLARMM